MTKNNIPAGTLFGKLVVLSQTDRISGGNRYYLCECACGKQIEVQGSHLLYSGITSCGCDRASRTIAGDRSTCRRLRQTWRHMISRCTDPTCKDYINYGQRSITVCPAWLAGFEQFMDWAIANGYQDDLSLDRVDNDGDYEPDNCRWATLAEQNRNTRRVRRMTAFGMTKSLAEWADDPQCQVTYFTLRQRVVYLGWSIEAALLTGKHQRPLAPAA